MFLFEEVSKRLLQLGLVLFFKESPRGNEMRASKISVLAAAAVVSLALGCTTTEKGEDTMPGDLVEDQGQDPVVNADGNYAPGPYGFVVGTVLPNYDFIGYANSKDPSLTGLQYISMSHFYNPTGSDVYPEGSPYGAGSPKPIALNMLTSALWCPPCNKEAKEDLPPKYNEVKPLGGHFITVMIDGNDPGTAATFQDITLWKDKYIVEYSLVVDPKEQVMTHYEPAFPGNMIIRTKDMKVVKSVAGVPNSSFWKTFEKVLDDEPIAGID